MNSIKINDQWYYRVCGKGRGGARARVSVYEKDLVIAVPVPQMGAKVNRFHHKENENICLQMKIYRQRQEI